MLAFRYLLATALAWLPVCAGAVAPLLAARVVDVARAAIDARLGDARAGAVVSVIGRPEDLRPPAGEISLKARISGGAWPRARVSVPVDIYIDGRLQSTAVVWFALSLPTTGPGYADSYPAGTDIAKLSLSPVAYDAAVAHGALTALPAGTEPMRLHRNVRAGDPLRSDDFERWPDVARGDHVKMTIVSGKLKLSAPAIAIGDGSLGQRVGVLVDGAEAAVQADVTGKGEVQVGL